MSSAEWILVGVLAVMVIALFSRRVTPVLGVIGAVVTLYLLGVADFSTAFGGFANPAPFTIAALYVVAAGVERTGALQWALGPMLASDTLHRGLWRITVPIAAMSAFVANTPIVAMTMTPVKSWAEEHRIDPSKVLMPLSFATIIGGTFTAIGTSTTVVASGVLEGRGLDAVEFWEPARMATPFIIVGVILVAVLAPVLLPDRQDPDELDDDEDSPAQPYVVSLIVVPGGPLDGATIADGGLRSLHLAYVAGVERDDNLIAPVAPEFELQGDDVVLIAGRVDEMLRVGRLKGLELAAAEDVWSLDNNHHAWFEAIIGAASPLVGRTIKQVRFREHYQAAVVGLRRSGTDVTSELGEARLQVGDSLLLISDLGFANRWNNQRDFLLVHQHDAPPPTAGRRAPIAVAILFAMVGFTLVGVVTITQAAIWAAVATIISGILTPRQARDAINIDVIVMIAAAIGIGGVVSATGLDTNIATSLSSNLASLGLFGVALGVVLATALLTELVSNAGAVAVMVPIALSTANDAGGDVRRFALGVILASSASFLTPIGYQTNTMVLGPGRYRPSDFVRFGFPFTVLAVLTASLYMAYGW